MPSGLKLNSESKIQLHPAFEYDGEVDFTEQEQLILNVLGARSGNRLQ
jgi:hypothetical protein